MTLFPDAAVDSLSYWQARSMPDRAFVFTLASIERRPGGVAVGRWRFARIDACRLTQSRASERDAGGIRTESHAWTLARPAGAPAFSGDERLIVLGARIGAVTLRVSSERRARTYQTVRRADVTADDVPPFVLATTRATGPARLTYSTAIAVDVG